MQAARTTTSRWWPCGCTRRTGEGQAEAGPNRVPLTVPRRLRPRAAQALSRRTVAFRPLIIVARSAETTSFAAGSGTSTSANRWWISIAPMSRPFSPVSPVIAPTRSPGGCRSRPSPTNSAPAGPPGSGRRSARPLAPGPPSRSCRKPTCGISCLVDRSAGLVRELHRRESDVDEVEFVGEGLDHDAEALEVVTRAGSPAARRGSVRAAGRAGRRPWAPSRS